MGIPESIRAIVGDVNWVGLGVATAFTGVAEDVAEIEGVGVAGDAGVAQDRLVTPPIARAANQFVNVDFFIQRTPSSLIAVCGCDII